MTLYQYIQNNDKTAVLTKDPSGTAMLLYENELQISKYTLFPLRECEAQTVNSLRALIKLLFVAPNKNKKPFTDAITNIIERGKKGMFGWSQ